MNTIGFDVSRDTADYALLTRSLKVKEQSSVPNTTEDIMEMLQPIAEKRTKLTVGVESTAMYHLPVVEACTALNIPCRLINPILTKEMLKSSIRKRKTDREDAVVIAKLVQQGEGQYVFLSDLTDQLKVLVRSALKVGYYARSFSAHVRHVERIMGCAPSCLEQEEERLHELHKELRKEAVAEAPAGPVELLTSIPGIGQWLAAVILAETRNMERYPTGDALIAAAGLDPRVRQSGACLRRNGKITKRGSPHLRYALFCATMSGRQHDPDLRRFYERKRKEGKGYKVAMIATTRKLAYRAFAVMKRGTPYVKKEAH